MTSTGIPAHSLSEELQTVLVGLGHARQMLGKNKLSEMDELWQRLEKCAHRLAKLDHEERDRVRPAMLSLLDELQKTITAFDAERRDLGDKLEATHRNMAAEAAYRQAKAR